MLKLRIISALVLLPLVVLAFIIGPPWFVVFFFLACCALCAGEMSWMLIPALERKLTHKGDIAEVSSPDDIPHYSAFFFPMLAIALSWAMFIISLSIDTEVTIAGVASVILLSIPIGTFSSGSKPGSIEIGMARAFGLIASTCYGTFPWIVAWQLYIKSPNSQSIILVMAITWMGDTGGYFGGRFLGGRLFVGKKFVPHISPKKTWEGCLTGLVFSMLGALAANIIFKGALGSPWLMIGIGLIGGASAQGGDLVESAFKRFCGVKDSGSIIPGHGGFLDRIDGIIYSTPVIWAMLYTFA